MLFNRIRWCGALRFDIYGFWRFLFLRKYYAEFYYLNNEHENFYDDKDLPGLNEKLDETHFTVINGKEN